jgi:hypothetical protein
VKKLPTFVLEKSVTFAINNSTEEIPCWEANSRLAGLEISCLLWALNTHHRVHRNLLLVHVNPAHTLILCLTKIHFNYILHLTIVLPNYLKFCSYVFPTTPLRPVDLFRSSCILCHLSTQKLAKSELCTSSLYSFLQTAVASSSLLSNVDSHFYFAVYLGAIIFKNAFFVHAWEYYKHSNAKYRKILTCNLKDEPLLTCEFYRDYWHFNFTINQRNKFYPKLRLVLRCVLQRWSNYVNET